jgi:hypothetical protein
MKRQSVTIHPESGRLTVDFTTGEGCGTCLIEFGHSFTLRLEEDDIDKLREALYEASKELMFEQNAIDMANGEPFDQNGNAVNIDELPPITESVIEPELWARLQK